MKTVVVWVFMLLLQKGEMPGFTFSTMEECEDHRAKIMLAESEDLIAATKCRDITFEVLRGAPSPGYIP